MSPGGGGQQAFRAQRVEYLGVSVGQLRFRAMVQPLAGHGPEGIRRFIDQIQPQQTQGVIGRWSQHLTAWDVLEGSGNTANQAHL